MDPISTIGWIGVAIMFAGAALVAVRWFRMRPLRFRHAAPALTGQALLGAALLAEGTYIAFAMVAIAFVAIAVTVAVDGRRAAEQAPSQRAGGNR